MFSEQPGDARLASYGWWPAPMATPENDQTRFRFSIFEVDLAAGELFRRGVPLSLQEKPFHILALLLDRSGEIVTREELQSRLWADGTFVDFDKGLNTAMKKLRQALGDSSDAPIFIETVHRRGYRFIAPVYSDEQSALTPVMPNEAGDQMPAVPRDAGSNAEPALRGSLPRTLYLLIALGLAILVVGAGAVWFWRSQRPALSLQTMRITPVTSNGKVRQMAIAPNGKFVVFALRDGIRQALWTRDLSTNSEMQLLAFDTVNFPGIAISPDSRYVYFGRSETTNPSIGYLCRILATGGPVEKLIADGDSTVSFSPDGRQFVYTRGFPNRNLFEVRIANADGSNDHPLKSLSGHQVFEAGATWSPRNDVVAVPVHSIGQVSRFALDVISLRDAHITELLSSKGTIGRPLWLASGRDLLVAMEDEDSHRHQLWTVSYPEAQARRLTNDLSDYSSAIDLSGDGSKLATMVTNRVSNLWTVPTADQSHPVQLTSGEPSLFQVHELPDGRLLALGEGIWSLNANATGRLPLPGIVDAQWIEPCGESIVAVSRKDGNAILMRVGIDGTSPRAIASGDVLYPSCSPDGKDIYFFNFASPEKIHRLPIEGGSPVELADVLGITMSGNLAVSPDGKLLAYPYQQYSPPLVAIAVIPSDGGPPLKRFQVPGFVERLGWSSDGKALEYLLTQNSATNIWEQKLSGGDPKQITTFPVGQIFDFRRSRDGKRILMARGQITRDIVLIQDFQTR